MNKGRRLLPRIRACLGIVLLFALSAAALHAETIAYRDKLGRTVAIPLPVRRAVLFETYELAAALGVWDRVAGISRYAYENDLMKAVRPGIAKAIPNAGSGADMNIETLLKLRPDLVITWAFKPDAVRFMEGRGLKVIALYPESIPELYEVMRLQGKLFEKGKKVEQSIAGMEKIFSLIGKRTAGIPKEKRTRVIWLGGKPTTVAGNAGISNDLIGRMNGVNPASAIKDRNADVSMERIIAWNPQVIFIWGSAKYGPEDLLSSPQWRHVDAVRHGRVYKAPNWSTWSPRLALISLWMATKTYPACFKDVSFDKTADAFYRRTYGIPYGSVNRIEE